MLATCPQQVVRVGLVEFAERHDTWTNGPHYTAAGHRPTNQVSAWQADGEVTRNARHARHPRSIDQRGCHENATKMLYTKELLL